MAGRWRCRRLALPADADESGSGALQTSRRMWQDCASSADGAVELCCGIGIWWHQVSFGRLVAVWSFLGGAEWLSMHACAPATIVRCMRLCHRDTLYFIAFFFFGLSEPGRARAKSCLIAAAFAALSRGAIGRNARAAHRGGRACHARFDLHARRGAQSGGLGTCAVSRCRRMICRQSCKSSEHHTTRFRRLQFKSRTTCLRPNADHGGW